MKNAKRKPDEKEEREKEGKGRKKGKKEKNRKNYRNRNQTFIFKGFSHNSLIFTEYKKNLVK